MDLSEILNGYLNEEKQFNDCFIQMFVNFLQFHQK